MPVKYLVRFDDICDTMNWRIWEKLEKIFLENDIKPILAVVPDNRDKKLMADTPAPDFWERVRFWQSKGWTIGLHGHQHLYTTNDAGLVGLNSRSEFAGIAMDEQDWKIKSGIDVFRKHQVVPEIWVAPGHSFDVNTVKALKNHGIDCISDGFFLSPHVDKLGVIWVPQQLWNLRKAPFGTWTACFHHNGWSDRDVDRFAEKIVRFRKNIVGLAEVLAGFGGRRKNVVDVVVSKMSIRLFDVKKLYRSLRKNIDI